jgi:cobalamin biosynthesis Mg chelatase CobN
MSSSPRQDFKFDAVPSGKNIVAQDRQECKTQMCIGAGQRVSISTLASQRKKGSQAPELTSS